MPEKLLNGNGRIMWVFAFLLSATTFATGLTIGYYKAMSELKPLISVNANDIKHLCDAIAVNDKRLDKLEGK